MRNKGANGKRSNKNSAASDSIRISGIVALSSITSDIAVGSGAVLVNQVVAPSQFPNSAFGRRSQLWQRYKVNGARVVYTPSIPQSVNCNLVAYWEPDATQGVSTSDDALNVALAHRGAKQAPANSRWSVPCPVPGDWLFTQDDDDAARLSQMGRVVVVQRQSPVDFNGSTVAADIPLGDLTLEFDVTFKESQLAPQQTDLTTLHSTVAGEAAWYRIPSSGVIVTPSIDIPLPGVAGVLSSVTFADSPGASSSDVLPLVSITGEEGALNLKIAEVGAIGPGYLDFGNYFTALGCRLFSQTPLEPEPSRSLLAAPPTIMPLGSSPTPVKDELMLLLSQLVSQNALAAGNSNKASTSAVDPAPRRPKWFARFASEHPALQQDEVWDSDLQDTGVDVVDDAPFGRAPTAQDDVESGFRVGRYVKLPNGDVLDTIKPGGDVSL